MQTYEKKIVKDIYPSTIILKFIILKHTSMHDFLLNPK